MEDDFTRLVARLDYPMFVVTARAEDDGERSGCLVGFATQCSIHPPRFAVWISKKNHTFGVAQRTTHLAVHAPGDGPAQRAVAELFGATTGDEVDKFEQCRWHDGPEGAPILDDVPDWFVGHIVDRLDTGDHVGHVLDVVAANAPADPGLTFQDVKNLEPGHEP